LSLLKNKYFRIGAAVAIVVAAGGAFWHFRSEPNVSAASAVQGQITTAQKGSLKIEVTASGNLAFSQTADCAFEIAGYVDKVFVEAGDAVKKDQLLAQIDPTTWEDQKASQQRSVIQARVSLKNSQLSLENTLGQNSNAVTGTSVAPDPLDVEIKQLQFKLAQANLDNAQKQLDKLLAVSPEVRAPFDGFVTKVNVKGGDEVFKGTIAVSMADPNKFEASVLVNEMDIPKIQVGTQATLAVTSLPNIYLPAKVVSVSPTATISGGVVNYSVKVEVQNEQPQPGQNIPGAVTQSSTIGQASRASFADTASTGNRTFTARQPTYTPPALRDGLSINVSLLILEKQNVVLVPIKAIVRQGRDSIVQLLKDDLMETRIVKVGDSNTQFTEVMDGLSGGEQIVIPAATSTTSTTNQPRMGGMGGMPRIGR
jgi:RND family efflux transporter MFP subunit